MSTFTERIREAMALAHGVKQADLARACGISTASVNNWFSGLSKSLRGKNLLIVAEKLGVSPLWLSEGRGPMKAAKGEELAAVTAGPFVFAGVPWHAIHVDNADMPPVLVYAKWLEDRHFTADALRAYKVKGRCMEASLFESDLLIANTADRSPRDSVVFVVRFAGDPAEEIHVRRFRRDGARWMMYADNPDQVRHAPKAYHPDEDEIIGAAVFKQSEIV
jgi:phage repressor protein C with HTH and peptisase S24 domain